MKIIIPMAGMGSRLRPHTLTTLKPFIPIAGKPIVERLLFNLTDLFEKAFVKEICFVIKKNDEESQEELIKIGKKLNIKTNFYIQEIPLGTAHALFCAAEALKGPVIIAFADTLFQSKLKLKLDSHGAIWTKEVKDPSSFGVVKCNEKGFIKEVREKPKTFFSNSAIIGIYYFKEANNLKNELNKLNFDLDKPSENQFTIVLDRIISKGLKFRQVEVDNWMDCGNKTAVLNANHQILDFEYKNQNFIHPKAIIKNSIILKPCFIGKGAYIENSKVGPFVSVGKGTKILSSNICHSLIQENVSIAQSNLSNSMMGNHAICIDQPKQISLGDYSSISF